MSRTRPSTARARRRTASAGRAAASADLREVRGAPRELAGRIVTAFFGAACTYERDLATSAEVHVQALLAAIVDPTNDGLELVKLRSHTVGALEVGPTVTLEGAHGSRIEAAFARALAMEVVRPEPAPAWMPGCAIAPRVIVKVLGAHRLEVVGEEVVGEEVRLDGLVVAHGAVVARVVGWLADRHAEDVRDGKAPGDHCWLTAQEIADEVGGTRDGVRKVIARFRADARRVHLAESGVDLGEDGVVEFGVEGFRQLPRDHGLTVLGNRRSPS